MTITQVGFKTRDGKTLLTFSDHLIARCHSAWKRGHVSQRPYLNPMVEHFWTFAAPMPTLACGKQFTGSCRKFRRELERRAAPKHEHIL